jgi:hypothetical protein
MRKLIGAFFFYHRYKRPSLPDTRPGYSAIFPLREKEKAPP